MNHHHYCCQLRTAAATVLPMISIPNNCCVIYSKLYCIILLLCLLLCFNAICDTSALVLSSVLSSVSGTHDTTNYDTTNYDTTNYDTTTTLVLYAYSEVSPVHRSNGIHFLNHGLNISSNSNAGSSTTNHVTNHVTIIFIINGESTLDDEPDYALKSAVDSAEENPNLTFRIIRRPNTCFDFSC